MTGSFFFYIKLYLIHNMDDTVESELITREDMSVSSSQTSI